MLFKGYQPHICPNPKSSRKAVILRDGPFWYFSHVTFGIDFCIDYIVDNSNQSYFLWLWLLKKLNRMQNKHFSMSEQTSQKKKYSNTKPEIAKFGITISKWVSGIIFILN